MVRLLGEHRSPRFNAASRRRCAWAAAVSAFIGLAGGCGKPYRVESDPPGAIVSWKPGTGSPLVTPCEVQPGVHCGVVARFIRVRWDSDVSEWQELDGRSVYRFVQGEASTAPKSGGDAGGEVDAKLGAKAAVKAETEAEMQARIAREQQLAAEAARARAEQERLAEERRAKETEQARRAAEERRRAAEERQRAAEERQRAAEERRRKELADRVARLREDLERIDAELAKPALDAALRRELEAERSWLQAELKKSEASAAAPTAPATPDPAAPPPSPPSPPSPPAPVSPTPGAGGEVGR